MRSLPLAAQPTSLRPEGRLAKVVQELLLGWYTSMVLKSVPLLPAPATTKSFPATTALQFLTLFEAESRNVR